jgi:hypothetical protein
MEVSNPEGLGDAAQEMGRWRNADGSAAVWSVIPKDYTTYFNGMTWVIVAILRQAVQRLASCVVASWFICIGQR